MPVKSLSRNPTASIILPIDPTLTADLNVEEVSVTESLLSPTVFASIKVHQTLETEIYRNMDLYYAKPIIISLARPFLRNFFQKDNIGSELVVFRISNRNRRVMYSTEEFIISACSPSFITDAKTWVPDHWASKTPSEIVENIYTNVLNIPSYEIEKSNPPIDFAGERLHPFQIISQMAERAITNDGSNDPSFIHYMTMQNSNFANILTHNFKSLRKLTEQSPIMSFSYSFKNLTVNNYYNPFDIMSFSFPCDFDLMSDIMNGYDETGKEIFTLTTIDSYKGLGAIFKSEFNNLLSKYSLSRFSTPTNLTTASMLNSNPTNVENYLLKRKARMSLLNQDKIALKMTVPFNPMLSVGKVISVTFKQKPDLTMPALYGSGNYLIVNMTHVVRPRGLAVTNLDCVAKTVGIGIQ